MAKFQPQNITCPHCGHQSCIVTEDIHKGSLVVFQGVSVSQPNIGAQIECPICNNRFNLVFEWRRTLRDEMFFVCTSQPNVGLEMWRWMVGGEPLMPQYKYNPIGRTQFEQSIDRECKKIAAEIVGWGNMGGAPGRSLEVLLGHAEDYTKKKSWNNFTKKHFMVVVCENGLTGTTKHGYSGKFAPVQNKNRCLKAAIRGILKPGPDNKSIYFCYNPVGNCAEVHAANSLLYYEPQFGLNYILFSTAYITRFGIPRSYCMNCIALFQLRNG